MPRKVGIGAIKSKQKEQALYKEKGTEIAEANMKVLTGQLQVFQSSLESFASKHKDKIRKNPEFRVQFQNMCASVGVDPLASSKGFWSEVLGVGDYYYELGVQIIEVCLSTSHRNGGLIRLSDLKSSLKRTGGKARQDVQDQDILTAIKKLKVLGSGFRILAISSREYIIQSVPTELSMDHTTIIQLAQDRGYTTTNEVKTKMQWDTDRILQSLECLIKEGLVWIDRGSKTGETFYWFPSLFSTIVEREQQQQTITIADDTNSARTFS